MENETNKTIILEKVIIEITAYKPLTLTETTGIIENQLKKYNHLHHYSIDVIDDYTVKLIIIK